MPVQRIRVAPDHLRDGLPGTGEIVFRQWFGDGCYMIIEGSLGDEGGDQKQFDQPAERMPGTDPADGRADDGCASNHEDDQQKAPDCTVYLTSAFPVQTTLQ